MEKALRPGNRAGILLPPEPDFKTGHSAHQVAEQVGVSLSRVMQVNRGATNLSAKAKYKLEQLELEATARTSTAERIVQKLLNDG
jgi:transcriptional regulator with XRE-family HTH domain